MIEVVRFNDLKSAGDDIVAVVTVSKSKEWCGLSPFLIGPCQMWGGRQARNMENAWQYSKVYPEHLEPDGTVGAKWLAWATSGWYDPWARRYPMGKGVVPLFSWWDGRKLTYVEARKAIYIPLYKAAVEKTDSWKRLLETYWKAEADGKDLYLVDFDAYRHKGMGLSYGEVINDPSRKMGHAFVLAMMLEDGAALSTAIEEGDVLRGAK
jgi:hypothetical protein